MQNNFFFSIILYIAGILYTGYSIQNGTFPQMENYIVLSFLLLIIHDIILYWGIPTTYHWKKILHKKIAQAKQKWDITHFQYFCVFNRNIYFPVLLVGYLLLTVLWEISPVWGSDFFPLIKSITLILTIISGILTLYWDSLDDTYMQETDSQYNYYFYMTLLIGLSLWWTYIILGQTQSLGYLGDVISLLSGIIIFLVGISLLSDEEQTTIQHQI